MTTEKNKFKIKLSVAIFKENKLTYKNELLVPTSYTRRSEARAHIKKEIHERLAHSSFFISPRVDYDLVRYTQEASCNTYLRYRIVEKTTHTNKQGKLLSPVVSQEITKEEIGESVD